MISGQNKFAQKVHNFCQYLNFNILPCILKYTILLKYPKKVQKKPVEVPVPFGFLPLPWHCFLVAVLKTFLSLCQRAWGGFLSSKASNKKKIKKMYNSIAPSPTFAEQAEEIL